MKKTRFILMLVLFGMVKLSMAQNNLSLKILSCESTMLYIVRNDSLIFPNNIFNDEDPDEFNFSMLLNSPDADSLNFYTQKLLETRYNEFLDNYCIMDGWHYKILIEADGIPQKKIFIGNFYYPTFNRICRILNTYLRLHKTSLGKLDRLPVYKDDDRIEDNIIELFLCGHEYSEEEKQSGLNDWCEPPNWNTNNLKN